MGIVTGWLEMQAACVPPSVPALVFVAHVEKRLLTPSQGKLVAV